MNTPETPAHILKKYFGYDTFRPMQLEIIDHVLAKKDSLVIMPTGGGKSICFQIPAMLMEGTFIVLSPLIALMKDQVEGLVANGIPAAFINSTIDTGQEADVLQKLHSGKLKLLYLSPERFLGQSMFNILKNARISGFAIDEAHCISVWGHDFREEYGKLGIIKTQWPQTPVIALTATADKISRRDIGTQLKLSEPTTFLGSFNRPNISLQVLPGQKVYREVKRILSHHRGESGIIYCLSRKSCEEVAGRLELDGFSAALYHAGLDKEIRTKVQEDFKKDKVKIIVATIAFGMGIDKSNIRFVIHYNLPKNIEGYYQEIGRGGRDGLPCETVMFYSYRDVMILRGFCEESAQKEIQLAKLKRIQQYAEASVCRRKILHTYFGEDLAENCGNCDVCKNPPTSTDGTVIVQMALSALTRLNENVGIGTLIDVLRGSQKSYLFQHGYQEIKTYGAGKDHSYDDWQHYVLQMLHHGFLEIAYDQNHVLKITDAGREVLFKGRKVQMVSPNLSTDSDRFVKKEEPEKSQKQLFAEGLFDALRSLRHLIADSKGVPPYVIFSDATLKEMAAQHPVTLEEMGAISGVGEFKLAEYGDVFIREIIGYIMNSDIKSSGIKGKTQLETLKLIREGKSTSEIASLRGISESTIYGHLAALLERGLIMDISPYLSDQEIATIKTAVEAVGPTDQLTPIFNHMEGKVDFGKIRLFLSSIKAKGS